jgi:hypothetical protein
MTMTKLSYSLRLSSSLSRFDCLKFKVFFLMQYSSPTLCCFFISIAASIWTNSPSLGSLHIYTFLRKVIGQSDLFIMYFSSSLCLHNKQVSPFLLRTHVTVVYVFNIYCKTPLHAVMFRLLSLILRPSILVCLPRCYQVVFCSMLNLYAISLPDCLHSLEGMSQRSWKQMLMRYFLFFLEHWCLHHLKKTGILISVR